MLLWCPNEMVMCIRLSIMIRWSSCVRSALSGRLCIDDDVWWKKEMVCVWCWCDGVSVRVCVCVDWSVFVVCLIQCSLHPCPYQLMKTFYVVFVYVCDLFTLWSDRMDRVLDGHLDRRQDLNLLIYFVYYYYKIIYICYCDGDGGGYSGWVVGGGYGWKTDRWSEKDRIDREWWVDKRRSQAHLTSFWSSVRVIFAALLETKTACACGLCSLYSLPLTLDLKCIIVVSRRRR